MTAIKAPDGEPHIGSRSIAPLSARSAGSRLRLPRPTLGAASAGSGGSGWGRGAGGSSFARIALIGVWRGASGKRSSSIECRSRRTSARCSSSVSSSVIFSEMGRLTVARKAARRHRRRFAHAVIGGILAAMCGRVRLSSDVSEIKLVISIAPERPTPNFPPSWNAAPTDQLPIVRLDPKAGQRSLDLARWGLVPFWAKDIKVGSRISTQRPRASTPARPSAMLSNAAAALSRSITSMSGRRPGRQAALRHRPRRPRDHGAGRPMGELALARRGVGTELHDRHLPTERALH
jgi:SOS response associated peptidase (SRAP)